MIFMKRISRLKEYGIFKNFSWPAELNNFRRLNLVYGWNGSGKTTLARLFQQVEHRTAQKDTPFETGSFRIELSDDTTVTNNNIDTSLIPPLRVFNREFIQRNVKLDTCQADPIFFLGEENIDIQTNLERHRRHEKRLAKLYVKKNSELTKLKSEKESLGTNTAETIRTALRRGSNATNKYNTYDRRDYFRCVDWINRELSKDSKLTFELSEELYAKELAKTRSEIKDEINVDKPPFPDAVSIYDKIRKLLERSATNTAIDRLSSNSELEKWVGDGLPLHPDKEEVSCEFCGNVLSIDRRSELEAHFNKSFRELKNDVESALKEITSTKSELENFSLPHRAELFDDLWPDLKLAVSEFKQWRNEWTEYLEDAIFELNKKLASLHEVYDWKRTLPDEIDWSETNIVQLINLHNKRCKNFASEINDARRAIERHHVQITIEKCNKYSAEIERLKQLIARIGNARRKNNLTISTLAESLRDHRRPADQINKDLANYLGRSNISLEPTQDGYQIMRGGKRADNLSEGEQTALAFTYFLTTLHVDSEGFNLSESIVVIDDPISSLDSNAIYHAYGFMKERTKDAGQIIVLTHNYTFFQQVKKWFSYYKKEERSLYMLKTSSQNGEIESELVRLDPLLQDFESEYQYLYKVVYEHSEKVVNDLNSFYHMPNIARRLLESFLSFRQPRRKSATGLNERLADVAFDEAKKARILRYTNTLSHNRYIEDQPDNDLSILTESPAVLKDVLDLMAAMDPVHCQEMNELVGEAAA